MKTHYVLLLAAAVLMLVPASLACTESFGTRQASCCGGKMRYVTVCTGQTGTLCADFSGPPIPCGNNCQINQAGGCIPPRSYVGAIAEAESLLTTANLQNAGPGCGLRGANLENWIESVRQKGR
jgi:hypothetical protein